MASGSKALFGCAILALVALAAASALAQHQGPSSGTGGATQSAAGSRNVTMEELHRSGGVPPGWKFALPGGDAAKGRRGLRRFRAIPKCHAIQASFPATGGDAKNVGPAPTGMGGGQHPSGVFPPRSILAPNAVISDGPGYTGPDGKSMGPSFADIPSATQPSTWSRS
jgi:hypothetical protein